MIGLFLPSVRGGGAQRMMLNLARGFAGQGLDVDLVLAQAEGPYLDQAVPVPGNRLPADHSPQAEGPYFDQAVPEVRVVDLGARRVLASLPGLVRYLRDERPVALLATQTHANVVALWARRLAGVDTRVVVREANALSQVTQNAALARMRLFPSLARRFYPWADSIVAVSQGVAEDLARVIGLPRGRIRVIYNPAVTPELLERAQEPVDHAWFAPGMPPVILGVGRLTRQKDFPTLIRAFALMRQRRPARLVILGEGEQRTRIDALVSEAGLEDDVDLPGFVGNPYAYMARAAVFVLSSVWEGLPNVLVEAMATGTPVVSTDCESGPAEILEGGRYGRLVPVGDVEALAEAVLATLDAPLAAETLQLRAREFSLEKVLVQYLEVLGVSL